MGLFDSIGGFLGVSDGPQAPGAKTANQGLGQLNQQNSLYDSSLGNNLQDLLTHYAQGGSLEDALKGGRDNFGEGGIYSAARNQQLTNELATNPLTGSRFATDQVQSNPILGGLYGKGGQLGQAEDQLSGLYKRGFDLQPEDQTMYGQMSGNIARQFGQQGNQTANDLASRGLSNSGAAGAAFSGLAGNQNEQLAKAQEQIAQQRFHDTMNQVGQYQNFVSSMGANAGNAINQQYGRQLSGVENQRQGLQGSAGLQQKSNDSENAYGLDAANFNVKNQPKNFMDFATAGAGQGIQSGTAGATKGLFA